MGPEWDREQDVRWLAPAWAAALTTATACGQATGTGYQGDPLFTITGQMVTEGAAPSRPIRLAVAWYADHTTLGGPQAIVTEDIEYLGSFPLDYRFSFYGPPPDAALNATTAGAATFRAAWGVLIAYEDLNGNGQLDVIPDGGSPIDQILATSIGDLFNGDPAANPVRIAYIDGPPPAALEGFTAGYNFYQERGAALPKSTTVELDLSAATGPSELDLFVCPDFITGAYLASPNSAAHSSFDLPCNIPPTGGVRVSGSLLLANGVPTAWIRVTDGVNPLPEATVTVNGTPLTYSAFDGVFEGTGSGLAADDGEDDMLAVTCGGETHSFALSKPGDFAIEAPDPNLGPHFLAGSPVTVDWSSSTPAATVYAISLISTLPPYGADLKQQVTATSGPNQQAQIIAPEVDGPEWLDVFGSTSDQPVFGEGGSVIYPGTYRSAYIDLAPAGTGLTASGTLVVQKGLLGYDGSLALVQPYEGAVLLSAGASASVNGQPLSWSDAKQGFYSTTLTLDAGAPSGAGVTAPGLSPFEVEVPIPGDFSIQSPFKMIPGGSLVDLSWSPSSGARGYNVLVEVSDGGTEIPLTAVTTQDTSISLVLPTQPGLAQLVVVALGAQSDRHFSGAVEEELEILLQ